MTWLSTAAIGCRRPHTPVQRDRDQRPELALGHRAEAEQRHLRHLVAAHLLLDRQIADLRPVAVDDDHPPAGVEQRAMDRAIVTAFAALLVVGAELPCGEEGVAAEGDHRGPGHGPSLPLDNRADPRIGWRDTFSILDDHRR